MNKKVYLFLKNFFENQENKKRKKVRSVLERKLNPEEIEQFNIKYNDDIAKVYYNESDIKFLILNKNKNLFTSEEFNYYINLIGLKKFMKK